jgi:GntR family transcriptional regulator/MocR family aminotransferase
MRPAYRRRRDALLEALRERLPDFEPTGIAAGQHLVTWLPSDLDEANVVKAAARRGVGVYGVAPYRIASDGPSGLIFGYATLNERMIAEGVGILAEVVAELRAETTSAR